ncbi:MAG: hypothetical protein L0H84_21225 [Pseudonocardia sp.]|nr:hypothetical protein [Pseudonocardia sp.]
MTTPRGPIDGPRHAPGDAPSIDDAGLLHRCQHRIRAVLPTAPTGLEDLRQALSRHRRRRISVLFTDPAGLTLPAGLWLELDDHDLVWIDRRTSPMMRIVAACHEFGHIISGHQPTRSADASTGSARPGQRDVRALARDQLGLPTGAIQAIRMRCGDPHERGSRHWHEEREAEMIGRLLAARVLRHPRGLAQALIDL